MQLELEYIPLEKPKKTVPPMIKFSKFGNYMTLNKSFVDQSGFMEMKAPVTVMLATDKKKVLDWYLVITQENDKKGITDFKIVKGGGIQFKALNFVKMFLEDFAKEKKSIEAGISSVPIVINEKTRAFAIITKGLDNE